MRAGVCDRAIDGAMPIQTLEPDRQEYQSVFN
jgi:hypothetical protein